MVDDWVQSVLCVNSSYILSALYHGQQWQTIGSSLSSGYSLPSTLKPNNNLFSLQATASPPFLHNLLRNSLPTLCHSRCTTSNTENIRAASSSNDACDLSQQNYFIVGPVLAVKTYGELAVQLQLFLNFVPDLGEWSASGLRLLYLRRRFLLYPLKRLGEPHSPSGRFGETAARNRTTIIRTSLL